MKKEVYKYVGRVFPEYLTAPPSAFTPGDIVVVESLTFKALEVAIEAALDFIAAVSRKYDTRKSLDVRWEAEGDFHPHERFRAYLLDNRTRQPDGSQTNIVAVSVFVA